MKTKKKERSSPKIEAFFFPKSGEDRKKGLHRNLELSSARICRIYSCWLVLDRFIVQRSYFDGWTSKSRWEDAKSRPTYNLSTSYSDAIRTLFAQYKQQITTICRQIIV